MGGGVLNRKREVWERERWRRGISRLICLFPHADAPCWKLKHGIFLSSCLHIRLRWCCSQWWSLRKGPLYQFSFPPIPTLHLVWRNIFRLSPLWMCVHGVVLTKRDLVQARSVCLKAGLCDVAVLQGQASELCIYCITVSYGLYKKAFILFISLIAVLRCSQTNGFTECQWMSLQCI